MDYQPKDLEFDREIRSKIATGAHKLARAVVSTLGPRSNNVAIHQGGYAPRVIHDGVSVAREIRLKDRFEDLGCMLIREAAVKTNNLAGDGTTTATLLADTLLQEGIKVVDPEDEVMAQMGKSVNKMQLREDLLKFAEIIDKEIAKRVHKVEDQEELTHIATVSASDPDLGKMIADAYEKIGVDGEVLVEPFASAKDEIEVSQGYKFDNGMLSNFFATDPSRYVTEYKDTLILFADYTLNQPLQLTPIISKVADLPDKPALLIIAKGIEGGALNAMITVKNKLGMNLCGVLAPEFAERQTMALDDMALLAGGLVANPNTLPIESVEVGQLGRAKSVLVSLRDCAFIPSNPDNEEVAARIKDIKAQIKEEKTEWIQDKLRERLARLSQSMAIMRIFGNSNIDFDNRRERAIDAVFATKAALQDGYVLGGGATLKEVAEAMGQEEAAGLLPEAFEMVQAALNAPFQMLMKNSGLEPGKIQNLIDMLPDTVKNRGYDVVSKRAGDLVQLGIIDPAKVTRLAVQHAFSVAATILTTSVGIIDAEVEDGKRNV